MTSGWADRLMFRCQLPKFCRSLLSGNIDFCLAQSNAFRLRTRAGSDCELEPRWPTVRISRLVYTCSNGPLGQKSLRREPPNQSSAADQVLKLPNHAGEVPILGQTVPMETLHLDTPWIWEASRLRQPEKHVCQMNLHHLDAGWKSCTSSNKAWSIFNYGLIIMSWAVQFGR